ncbi:MAG TPA: hypothetical protein VIH61_02830, partial [Waddliaceae bacterium]
MDFTQTFCHRHQITFFEEGCPVCGYGIARYSLQLRIQQLLEDGEVLSCQKHGWFHSQHSCPACEKLFKT